MHIKNKRGQSTVEYVLLMTAVVVVIIAFVSSNHPGGFQAQLNTTLNQVTTQMNEVAGVLADSYASTTKPTVSATAGTPPYTVNPASGV